MPIDKTKLTNAMLIKAAKCETAEELIALAKADGVEITMDEAQAYLAETENVELDSSTLEKVAGGACFEVEYGCSTNCDGFKDC